MREPKPDIKIPLGSPAQLKELINREFARFVEIKDKFDRGVEKARVGPLLAEAALCQANFNEALDHYPHGKRRPDIDPLETIPTLEEAT